MVRSRGKDDGTPVSEVDEAVERALLDLVRTHRPGDGFLGEEVGDQGGGDRRWIVDGIDGTSNFVRGSPLWGTLISLVENGRPVLGTNCSPAQERRWWATRGGGAWTSSNPYQPGPAAPMSVSRPVPGRPPRASLELVWPGHPTEPTLERLIAVVEPIEMSTHPAIMVAAGEIDLAVQVDGGPWDFAGLMPMVWEAGGRCLDLHGHETVVPAPPMIYVGEITTDEVQALLAGQTPTFSR